jgi:L-rhamnose mutarotase
VRENGPKDYKAVMMDLKPETLSDFIKLTQPIWDEYKAKSEDCALLIELLKKAKDY